MELLTNAITLLRGYGLQTWSFWQDASQLTTLYPEWETLYNNCRIHQNFGITNARLAKQIAALTDYPSHVETLKLDNDEMLLQVAGDETVIAQRPNYLTDALFKGQADPNPFHTKEDDDELIPLHAQRRYKRRKTHDISTLSEIDDLKQQLKEAIKATREATEESRQARQELEKLVRENEAKVAKDVLNIIDKHTDDKTTEESVDGEPWST